MQQKRNRMEGQQKIKQKEIYVAEVLPNKYKGIIVTHDMLSILVPRVRISQSVQKFSQFIIMYRFDVIVN
jgi:hypothetical protein